MNLPQGEQVWSSPALGLSARDFLSDTEQTKIVGVTVNDVEGTQYTFVIDRKFLGPKGPAFILQSITPPVSAEAAKAMRLSKFWVYGGEISVGGSIMLKQGAQNQRVLNQYINVVGIQVHYDESAST